MKSNVKQWWLEEDKHSGVMAAVENIETSQTGRMDRLQAYARLYANNEALAFPHSTLGRTTSAPDLGSAISLLESDANRIKLNAVQSVIDTITARIGKSRPKISMLPAGGDWDIHRRARGLERYVGGVFYSTHLHDVAQQVFLDACVWGTGYLRIYPDEGRVGVERLLTPEVLVDPEDGVYGRPRSMYHRRYVAREVVEQLFPDHVAEIALAGTGPDAQSAYRPQTQQVDSVLLVEAWHLPSGKNAKDGRHVVCMDNITLLDEPYTKSYFPILPFKWKEPQVGFYGQSITQEIVGLQVEINRILRHIQRSFALLSTPWVMLPTGTKVSKPHIRAEIGAIIPFSGTQAPTVKAFQTVNPEQFKHLEFLWAKCFEVIGVSQLSAAARKPPGVEAAVALRELNDIESERFAIVAKRWEQFYIECGRRIIDVARDLYTSGVDTTVDSRARKYISKIKWSDVNMDDDRFTLQVGAASSLPDSKAGRLQAVTELLQNQMIDAKTGRDLLDLPDLESYTDLERAPRDHIREVIDRILDDGEIVEPEETDDLEFARQYTLMTYQKSKLDGAPEATLEKLRLYLDAVEFLLTPEVEQMPAPPQPMQDPSAAAPAQVAPEAAPMIPQ